MDRQRRPFTAHRSIFSLDLKQVKDKLTGNFSGDKLEGTLTGNRLHFLAKDEQGGTEECQAALQDGTLSGTMVFTDADDPVHPNTHQLLPSSFRNAGQDHRSAMTLRRQPYYREFSATNKPVLNVWPGDTVHTATVDADGTDERGVGRVLGGNPETGPFYVETAMPGDTLVVRLTRPRLNRHWAISDDVLVDRALNSGLAIKMKDAGKTVRWHLDIQQGAATPERQAEHLIRYTVPHKPMLGCVAVAPNSTPAAPGTGDSGRWGGNMDFNEVVEMHRLPAGKRPRRPSLCG
jgi:hypothetical protein